MKICVPMKSTMIHNHFGRAPEFTMIVVEAKNVVSREVVKNPGREQGHVPNMMPEHGVTHVIAGGIGQRAKTILKGHNIVVISGVMGSIDNALDRFIKGELKSQDKECCGDNVCGLK